MANVYKTYLVIFLTASERQSQTMAKSLIVSNFMPKWQPICITKAIKLSMYFTTIYPPFAVLNITMYALSFIPIANKPSFLCTTKQVN